MIALLLLLAGTGKGGKSIWDKNFNDEFRQSLKVIPSSCLRVLVSSCLVSSFERLQTRQKTRIYNIALISRAAGALPVLVLICGWALWL